MKVFNCSWKTNTKWPCITYSTTPASLHTSWPWTSSVRRWYETKPFVGNLRPAESQEMLNEFSVKLKCMKPGYCTQYHEAATFVGPHRHVELPTYVDWREQWLVKNQANCGSCWAFSATRALECQLSSRQESLWACPSSTSKTVLELSGTMDAGVVTCFGHSITSNLMALSTPYPYTAYYGKGHFEKKNIRAKARGYYMCWRLAVALVSPISAGRARIH